MANYHNLKNAAILTPTTGTDLGSDSNRYSNVFMSGNIVMSNGVTVTSSNVIAPRVSSLTYPGTETATDTAGGETIIVTGSGFNNTGGTPSVIVGSSVAPVVTYISPTSVSFTAPALSAGTYVLYVINADGGTATYLTGISYSGTPTWTTSAGSLGNVPTSTSANLSVAATGDAPITYAVKSGSTLPTGLSLNTNTGAITGTAPTVGSQTTYSFTLTAKDGQNQTTDRSFSITVITTVTAVEYLVVAGGGAGGNGAAGGGGAGGYRTNTGLAVTTGSPITVTVGGGGTTAVTYGANGTNSVFGSITATGGGGGGHITPTSARVGRTGGSGGGGGGFATAGDTTPGTGGAGNAGSYTPVEGYAGGAASNYGGGGGGAGAVGTAGTSGAPGAGGTGALSTITTNFAGTASIASNTTLTVTAVSAGVIGIGTQVTGTNIPGGTYIIALGTGTGSTGTYIMSTAATATGSGVSITSSGVYYAGGGGSSGDNTSGSAGGAGGGGAGQSSSGGKAYVNAGTNTGGGGGGGGGQSGSGQFGQGGSGIVIIRYDSAYPAATSTTGSPTVTTAGGYRIYKWTSSGSITF